MNHLTKSPLRPHVAALAVVLALSVMAGCSRDGVNGNANPLATSTSEANAARIVLPFVPGDFVAGGTNPFFPLTPGLRYSYREETADGLETNTVEVTSDTKVILGVTTTVIRDKVYLDGSLIEDTFDWYAQDKHGNVWYLGEDTKEYENGVVVSTAGSWEAGVNGAQAGIIMLANPKVGDQYYQENAPGVVEDQGKVLSLKETVSGPYGTFTDCLVTADWTPIEPGNRTFKYYARGIGLVMEVTPHGGRERLELVEFSRP